MPPVSAPLPLRPPVARPPWWTCATCDDDIDARFAERDGHGRFRCPGCAGDRG